MPNFPSNPTQGMTYSDPATGIPWIYQPSPQTGYPLWMPNTPQFFNSIQQSTPQGGFSPVQGNSFNFNLPQAPAFGTTDMGGGNGGFFGPAGNWTTGQPTGDFGTQGGGGGGMPFWQQALLNTGTNLLGGFLQNRAISGAQNQSNKAIQDRIRQALATLSPQHIQALAQQFLPQMAANNFGAGQTAIAGLREQAARTGQLEGPRELSVEAGTRAKLASDTQRQAFESAMNLTGSQANAITGAPYTPIQPKTGYADALLNSANQAWQARFYQNANKQQTGVPYRFPGMGSYGNQGSYGWGY